MKATYVCAKTVFEVQPSLMSEIGPLDLYRFGNSYPIGNEKPLHQRVLDACQTIRSRPWTFERARQSIIRYMHASIDSGVGHFQHLLRTLT